MAIESMLTTKDNPYNPFEQYDEWFRWDAAKGYHTPSYLARLVAQGHELSEQDQKFAIEIVIEEIVSNDVTDNYKRVTREVEDSKE